MEFQSITPTAYMLIFDRDECGEVIVNMSKKGLHWEIHFNQCVNVNELIEICNAVYAEATIGNNNLKVCLNNGNKIMIEGRDNVETAILNSIMVNSE